jgi:hypothetical protein
MAACTVVRARLLLLGVFALACSRDDRNVPLAPPSYSLQGDPTWSGAVLGPDGSSICNFIPGGEVVRLRPINPATGTFGAGPQVLCPGNTFAFSLAPGSYLVRAVLPPDPGIGSLPQRDVEPQTVDGAAVVHDVTVQNGTPLGGAATLDGAPLPDVALTIVYDQAPGFLTASGGSGADGTWTEFFRAPMILQNNVRYQVSGGCGALGVQALEGPPAGGFLFPSDVSVVNCRLATAPAVQFSHTLTRLVVSPLPGDVGGQSPELSDRYGVGWGVQFPVPPGTSPVHIPVEASQLFLGGLIIGIAPDRVLTGTTVAGEMECGAACRDLGLDATLGFTDQTPAGRKVLWQYSDAPSPEGVGLRIRQRSFDGVPPNDYVLFDFSIQNQGSSSVTFYAGFWGDWDVDLDATDDLGFTDMNGKLMFMTSAFENTGVHVGTLLGGDAPVSGNFFFVNGDPLPSLTDQVQALSGGLRRETAGPGDLRYIHGIGPITLARGKRADLWVAIVAGDSRDQLFATASAADADISDRQHRAGSATDGVLTVTTPPLGVPMRPFSKGQKPQ